MSSSMRARLFAAAIAGLLAGCGAVDRNSFVPSPWRQPEAPAADAEAEPDVKALVQAGRESLFASKPSTIAVSPPRRNPQGRGFTICVKALVTAATGHGVLPTTLLVSIQQGKLGDRRRAVPQDGCEAETYEKV
jgi:hypothetical protein